MARSAICIDAWKLDIFDKELRAAGFDYEEAPGVTKDTLTLTVVTNEIRRLALCVNKANQTAATEKRKRKLN